ncbi:MAG: ribosomal L7Ae/L30e/S12e/Gadd45 family protein [Nitrososphaerota archaeon]|jgi:large subunit ribosomal protein L30e|nr:ribosomal L7Ae/L30e/S12e/Gadd45 family protein [Nitrososphaerota archaeon]
METRLIEPFLKSAAKTGRVTFGMKETLKALKGSKVVVLSTSATKNERDLIRTSCKSVNVPLVSFDDTSVVLGRLAGVGHPVKVLAVRSAGDADVDKLLRMANQESVAQKI